MIAAAVAGVLVAGVFLSTIAFKKDEVGFTIGATHQITNLPGAEVYPAVSPDGKMVTYVQNLGGKGQIFLRQISGGRAVALTDSTVDASWPRWKPDGSAILFTADGTVFTIPSLGGSATAILSGSGRLFGLGASSERGGRYYAFCDWSPSGTVIICANHADGALYRLDAGGENVKRLTTPGSDILHSAAWSPDGKRIAYVNGNLNFVDWQALGNLAASSIWVMPAAGGEAVRITEMNHLNMSPVWAPDGSHVLFVSTLGGTRDIYSQAVTGSGASRGAPVRLTTGLNPHTMSLSADGRSLVYSVFTTTANVWGASLRGTDPIPHSSMRQITFGNQTIESMAVSPDGRWLAYDSNLNGNSDIYKLALAGGEPQQVTRDPADDFSAQWSPDGKELAFHSFRNGNRDIFVVSADGSRTGTVTATPNQELTARWSPDGRSIAYYAFPDSVMVVTRTAAGWGKPQLLTKPGAAPEFSPDGTKILYAVPDGLETIPVAGGPPTQVVKARLFASGAAGGFEWSRDSKWIYYCSALAGQNWFWVVPSTGGTPKPVLQLRDPLRQLFRGSFALDSSNIYFTIGSRDSDVWVMELSRK